MTRDINTSGVRYAQAVDAEPSTLGHVVVVGGGPVGLRFARELLQRVPDCELTLLGNEASQPYNRVQLSSLLNDDISYESILSALPSPEQHPRFRFLTATVREIDTAFHTIKDSQGQVYVYDTLVLATGSRPHVPNIPGVQQTGVFTFRNLRDAEHLYARRARSRKTVIVGGGLLGLEAARALCRHHTDVTVVQQGPRLMNRQLDPKAAALLQKEIESLGIRVITDTGVREILGDGARATAVVTRDGQEIPADTILICAGVRANLELARNAKIKVGHGILVDDQMRCSEDNIFAIGECCEHRGLVYGLVNPGFEQAAIAADVICGGPSRYQGSLELSRLKVVGVDVCSMGDIEDAGREAFRRELRYQKNGEYRRLTLHRGRLRGALAIGDWPESRRLQDAYQHRRRIWPWEQWRFLLTGYVWGRAAGEDPALWPASALICQCNQISQGQVVALINEGVNTTGQICTQSGAGTVCGSCRPLISQLCGSTEAPEKTAGWTWMLLAGVLTVLAAALMLYVPGLRPADSVQTQTAFEHFWNNKYWKQVTGFSVLGLTLFGLLMSLRKRFSLTFLGPFAAWRGLHIGLALLCILLLFFHTGFHTGENLNRLLMYNFLTALVAGAIAGGVLALSHRLKPGSVKRWRQRVNWVHLLVTWPLPILVAAHIITVYYF